MAAWDNLVEGLKVFAFERCISGRSRRIELSRECKSDVCDAADTQSNELLFLSSNCDESYAEIECWKSAI